MAQSQTARFDVQSLSGLEWLAILLVLVTGVLHVYAGVIEARAPVALAGVGFLAAIVVYLLGYRRRLLTLVGIGFTGIQIPIWYVVKAGEYTTVGYIDKAVQVVLVVLLAYLYWQGLAAGAGSTDQPGTGQSG